MQEGPGNGMSVAIAEKIRDFYESHPYPGPVEALEAPAEPAIENASRRAEHALYHPFAPYREDASILVAGCGTTQAARHALRWPAARVLGIDVSESSLRQAQALKDRHGLANLELRRLAVEQVGELGERFDRILCTGVLHHLPDPERGLSALREALARHGSMHLMVYAPYGRAGVYLLQEYCRRLAIGSSVAEIHELVAALRTLPKGHPLWPLLRESSDFRYDAGIADALLHPNDRPYSVPQFLSFIARGQLRFVRWLRQAPYLPACGTTAGSPHRDRLASLPAEEQYAAMELFRGTMALHHAIVERQDEVPRAVRFDDGSCLDHRPIRQPGTVCVEERLPPGAAGVLINRRHTDTDLILPIDRAEKRFYEDIDGQLTLRELAARHPRVQSPHRFVERLWQYDQVVLDAT